THPPPLYVSGATGSWPDLFSGLTTDPGPAPAKARSGDVRLERDEDRDPSRIRALARPLFLRERVLHALHRVRASRRDLLPVPPVLHRQAEAGRYRWPGGALPSPLR